MVLFEQHWNYNMVVEKISNEIARSDLYKDLLHEFDKRDSISIKGLSSSGRSLVLSSLFQKYNTNFLYVSYDEDHAEIMKDDLETILGESSVAFLPDQKERPYEIVFRDNYRKSLFQQGLEKIIDEKPVFTVTTSKVLNRKLPSHEFLKKQKLTIKRGETSDFEIFKSLLVDLGFSREPIVENCGEMSVHGGIIDIFPYSNDHPVRIEFFGDQIESIREFNITSQRSIRKISEIEIYPQYPEDQILNDITDYVSLLDYFNDQSVFILDGKNFIKRQIDENFEEAVEQYQLKKQKHDLLSPEEVFIEWEYLNKKFENQKTIIFDDQFSKKDFILDFGIIPQTSLKGNFNLLKEQIGGIAKKFNSIHHFYFLCESRDQIERLEDIMFDTGIDTSQIKFAVIPLNQGFIFPEANLVVFTDNQFYGRVRRRLKIKRFSGGLSFRQLKSLTIGDYVVHIDQGIGRYLGLKKITVSGHERECLTIEYRDGDLVYVPLEKMKRVQKYSAKEGMVPQISKLGTADWEKLKKRTKKKVKEIASELIKLYAERRAQKGYAFSEDSPWQRELEASFSYEETADQIKAIQTIKEDMENPVPMDRLVCGDVGYGKTEVAIRAAFKAVDDNKQVAILVPTTVLALQHYNTFIERLADYPIKIEMLSRFRTKAEQKKIVEWINAGKVDIVIGTHRLLSKDVQFKDVGLIIIDEEQRFGVRNKEKLKKLKINADVITMTATPIPRTLNMSLMGVRDLSLINTPPHGRLPIDTQVIPFEKEIIREAILREVQRGGQIFFVHNRVQSIYAVADLLKGLIPEASFVVAHGQMDEKDLENVMWEFSNKKYDCLISTMIIESGLDIPNVNTLIINRADRFGLSQLYQLRGRVGRSNQRAYAYLIAPPIKNLTQDAMKRLRTIEEFTELGSGFQIAMRDLQIRGAGNILGGEQSGFIVSLGFDLYTKILDEAVTELKQEKEGRTISKQETFSEPKVELNEDAYLPENYIEQPEERVRIYKRLVDITHLKELTEVENEMRDRFGQLPVEAINLLNLIEFKLIGTKLLLNQIKVNQNELLVKFRESVLQENKELLQKRLVSIVEKAGTSFTFVQNGQNSLGMKIRFPKKVTDRVNYAKNFLQSLL
ncbi:transcription-repair coupling factor [candidate division KSB1 bacterium]|nr:transcription-repair coupling factor [candidate division KSB1 bacterium]